MDKNYLAGKSCNVALIYIMHPLYQNNLHFLIKTNKMDTTTSLYGNLSRILQTGISPISLIIFHMVSDSHWCLVGELSNR